MPDQQEREDESHDPERARGSSDDSGANNLANDHKPENVANEPRRKYRITNYACRWFTLIVDILVFGAVAIYAFVAYQQWQEMTKSTKAATDAAHSAKDSITFARETAHLDQRAWVAVIGVEGGSPQADQPWKTAVRIKNAGKTFAKALRIAVARQPYPKGSSPNFADVEDIPKAEQSVAVLAPNGEYLGGGDGNKAKVRQAEIDQITSGQLIVFFYGKISYEDIFGCPHWTTFCARFNPSDGQYPACETYNDADNNRCP